MKRENRVRKHGKKYYKLTVDGKVYLIPERLGNYALENGVSEQAIRQRLSRGYSVTRACTEGIVR
ncbi:hypothetical protein 7F12_10 [uncultured Caudovirales phage]|uniref:Uncharacterized protein n=1 Tax=uncultured Caudovirales phage TaxID=2100421 RepID=A0A2H4JAP7_9CAUD|nr:hypothetical protein 7F12_10 [uncultured Caudovirales phage]